MVPSIMANEHYELHSPLFGGDWIVLSHDDTSFSSPRVAGKLKLQPNPFDWQHRYITIPRLIGTDNVIVGQLADLWNYGSINSYSLMTRLRNEALARFTGKIRRDHASLGMTVAGWNKSAKMIIDRSEKIADAFERRGEKVSKLSKWQARKILAQGTASAFLEWEFGWQPLISDIQDSLGTLGRNPPFPFWVKASAKSADYWKFSNQNNPDLTVHKVRHHWERWRATVSGRVDVVSENLFLVNKLGLLNLPSVAWDLVPWSFVLNMFGNFNQMVSSISDTAGTEVYQASRTTSLHAEIWQYALANPNVPPFARRFGSAFNQQFQSYKKREIGLPSPTFYWKWPDFSFETLAIAAALPLQKLNKLERIVRNVAKL